MLKELFLLANPSFKWVATFFVLFNSIGSYGQIDQKKIFPVSPEVATLGKFVDTPPGAYSGVVPISVPLYNVSFKSINIPLTLSYHAGGIKVDQEASWVGLGWDLFSGGFISQSIVGKNDVSDDLDSYPGYATFSSRFLNSAYSGSNESMNTGWNCTIQSPSELNESEIINAIKAGYGQPDIFTFSALGHSGKFIIEPVTKTVRVLQKSEEIQINRTPSGWEMKTLDGMTFSFSLYGSSATETLFNDVSYTWKLTQIKTYDGGYVNFGYENQYSEGNSISEVNKSEPLNSEGKYSKTVMATFSNDYYLTSIETPLEKIEFALEDRIDLKGKMNSNGVSSVRRLKEIVVKDLSSNQKKKSFEFSYSYFDCTTQGNSFISVNSANQDHLCKRLKLKSVREVGYDVSGKVYNPPYAFEYEGTSLPLKTSYAMDYWGYYNGQTSNTTLIPNLLPLYIGLPDYNDLPDDFIESAYRANRGPNGTYMKAGILNKVTLPTGGSQNYYYEPHTFSNFKFYNADQISNQEVLTEVIDKNNPSIYPVTKDMGMPDVPMNVAFEVTINRGHPDQGLTFDDMLGATVSLIKQEGTSVFTILKTWSIPNTMAVRNAFNQAGYYTINEKFFVTPFEGGKYIINASLPDSFGAQNTSTRTADVTCRARYSKVVITGNQQSYGGGLRIQMIELRDENNNNAIVKEYDYNVNGISSGILLSPPKFLSKNRITQKSVESYPTDPPSYNVIVLKDNMPVYKTASQSSVSLSLSANGDFIGYSTVTELTKSGNAIQSRIRYDFYNRENVYDINFPENPYYDNGLLKTKTYLTNTNAKIKEENFLYEPISELFTKGFQVEDNYIGPDGCVGGQGGVSTNPCVYFPRYTIRSYPVKSQYFVQTQATESTIYLDEAAQEHATSIVKTFNYDALGLKVRETSTTSGPDIMSNEYMFPIDYAPSYPSQVVQSMNADFYQPLIEHKQMLNNQLLKSTQITFEQVSTTRFGSLYLPKVVTELDQQSNITGFVRNNSFSELTGNATEMTDHKGVPTVIVWSSNGDIPVAKIEGLTRSQVNAIVDLNAIEHLNASQIKTQLLQLYTVSGARVALFIYNSNGQLIEQIDLNKSSTFYQYDSFGRLKSIRDKNNRLVKTYQYHLKNQPE